MEFLPSFDDGLTWQLYRSWNQSNPYYNDDNILSAYPNPFNNDGHIRITYLNGNVNDNAKIDIFDFSMNHIIHLNDVTLVNNQGQFIGMEEINLTIRFKWSLFL